MDKYPQTSSDISTSNCGPCLLENKTLEATMFCVECNEMMCDTCVGIHKRFPTLKKHIIVEQTDKEQVCLIARLLGDNCNTHEGKQLETFCKHHNELCCSVCVSLNHRPCKDLVYLPEFATDKTTKENSSRIIKELDQMEANFQTVKKKRQADKTRFDKELANSSESVDYFKKHLESELDRIYEEFETKLKMKYEKCVKSVETDLATCDGKIEVLNKVLKSLKAVGHDDARTFIAAGRAEEISNQIEEELINISAKVGQDSLVYELDLTLKNKLEKIQSFGAFQDHKGGEQVAGKRKT